MRIVYPEELQKSAVFPQCVDNQYVSPSLFRRLVEGDVDFTSPDIHSKRKDDMQTELIRTLIYSSEVVINRAYMQNNHLLFNHFLPGSTDYSEAFIEMVRQGVVLPYLFQHVAPGSVLQSSAFTGSFSVATEGSAALNHLLEKCGNDLSVLVLAQTSDQFRNMASRVSSGFENGVDTTVQLDELLTSNMYSEVFGDGVLDNYGMPILYEEGSELFRDALLLATEVTATRRNDRRRTRNVPWATRNDIYKSFLIRTCKCSHGLESRECQCITNGRYDKVDDSKKQQAIFGAKAIVDLIYATGIPDSLQRFVFTPKDLPHRNALQDSGREERMNIGVLDDLAKTAASFARDFHATANQAFSLPQLRDFDFEDVLEIRQFPEWTQFTRVQEYILAEPLKAAEKFDEFQIAFVELQSAISKYFDRAIKANKIRSSRCFSFATGAITILGDVVRIGASAYTRERNGDSMSIVIDRVLQRVIEFGREKIAVGPAKLLFEVMDEQTRLVSSSLSWSADWMTRQVAWEKKDLIDFLKQIKAGQGDKLVEGRGLPDAGTQ